MKKTLFWIVAPFAVISSLVVALPEYIENVDADPLGMPRSFVFRYAFTVQGIPADSRMVKAWVPIPQTNAHQTIGSIEVSGAHHFETINENVHGNRFILLDLPVSAERKLTPEITVSYRVDRIPNRTLSGDGREDEISDKELAQYLRPNRLIPLKGAIVLEANRITDPGTDRLTQARALYDNIVATVKYDKSGDGWGRGDAVYACDERAGNCTDFHSLFIAEARSIGIPARFVMGFPIAEDAEEGLVNGYHCWAEFYTDDHGWVPIDASEAHKRASKREAFFGGLDANRVAITLGRDIAIPGTNGEPFNYVIYPYVEVDGKQHDGVTTRFSFKATGPKS